MELNSVGVEINPLSVLMSNVKCNSLTVNTNYLKIELEKYFKDGETALNAYSNNKKGQLSLIPDANIDIKAIEEKSKRLSARLKDNYLRNKDEIIPQVLIFKIILETCKDKHVYDFLLLALSGAISDVARRTTESFFEVFKKRVNDLYLRLYLFQKLNSVLDIKVGNSECIEGDTRNMADIKSETINGIVNSPPYSVALDYIKNDYPQLVLLELTKSIEELDLKMMGNPRMNYNKDTRLFDSEKASNLLPESADKIVKYLIKNGRQEAGLRSYKFFMDMHKALQEMYRVMKVDSKCAIVIGNNHFKVGEDYIEVPNDKVILELAQYVGFKIDKFISRELHKSSEGNIREESIIILKKEENGD